MTYVKNIPNWPDPGGQIMDMNHNYFLSDKGHFPAGKTRKQQKHTHMLLKYGLSSSLLMTYVKNVSN